MNWTQALTIAGTNIALFLWATRQARSDYLHLDRKFEDSRKENAQTLKEIKDKMDSFFDKMIKIKGE